MDLKFGITHESFKFHYGVDEVRNDAAVYGNKHISLVTGRRDWAAFQVLLSSPEAFTLSTGRNPAFSVRGRLPNVRLEVEIEGLDQSCIAMYPEGMMEDDDRILKADILLRNETVHVEGGVAQPVWVEVAIPEDTPPGLLKGKIRIYSHTMFEDEVETGSLAFDIEVMDVLLPKPEDYSFHLDLWQHLSNIARKHEVPLWSDMHFRVVEEYVKTLAELGQKSITVIATEIPWSGQRCTRIRNYPSDLFEYSMVKVRKNKDGSFECDYSAVERYVELCFKYGIDKEIEVFGLVNIWLDPENGYEAVAPDYPDAIRVRYLDESDGCYKYMKSAAEIKEYIRQLEQFFIKKGWIDRVRVVADEPSDLDLYLKRLEVLKEVAPSFRYKTAINHVEFIETVKDFVGDYAPVLPCVCSKWDALNAMRGDIRGRLTWYVCCWPAYPNTFLRSPLTECRLIGILTAYMNFDGFLRWNYTVWPEHPREKIYYNYPYWSAGDSNFVYPSWDGRPLLTIRYKNLKRGIEDFELISMLKKVHPDPDKVLSDIYARIFRFSDFRDFYAEGRKDGESLYSFEYEDYNGARRMLLAELSRYKNQ